MTTMRRFDLVLAIAVLVSAAVVLAWFINWPMLILLALWPALAAGSAMHDLIEGCWEPTVLANLVFSLAILASYVYVPRLLWRRIRRPAPRHP